jgi:hypothetical protein
MLARLSETIRLLLLFTQEKKEEMQQEREKASEEIQKVFCTRAWKNDE